MLNNVSCSLYAGMRFVVFCNVCLTTWYGFKATVSHSFCPCPQFELLYIEVLYTIKHKVGTTSGHHLPFIQDLYTYARDAFGVAPDEHARLMARASEEKVSECFLPESILVPVRCILGYQIFPFAVVI